MKRLQKYVADTGIWNRLHGVADASDPPYSALPSTAHGALDQVHRDIGRTLSGQVEWRFTFIDALWTLCRILLKSSIF